MSDSASKYFEDLEDKEWWAAKALEAKTKETRFDRFKDFISKIF
tara:strand:- start:2356 stop:2487 length:132 start_codon:yes stop_codon:yes gene_type:complete